jgi:pantoate--beta-alanine ligase
VFGEKDWQQLAVIRRMTADLGLGVAIEGHPTIREADGLAMSSRNALLAPEDRDRAVALPQALSVAAKAIAAGEDVATALQAARQALVAAGFSRVDYIALVDGSSLEPLETATQNMRLLVAASIGGVRLIDNIAVTSEQQVTRYSPH